MPYKNNDYKNFIRGAEWRRIRAAHLKANPLCVFCKERGITKQAEQVDHITPCMCRHQRLRPNRRQLLSQPHTIYSRKVELHGSQYSRCQSELSYLPGLCSRICLHGCTEVDCEICR